MEYFRRVDTGTPSVNFSRLISTVIIGSWIQLPALSKSCQKMQSLGMLFVKFPYEEVQGDSFFVTYSIIVRYLPLTPFRFLGFRVGSH